jgi:hypothetical protein
MLKILISKLDFEGKNVQNIKMTNGDAKKDPTKIQIGSISLEICYCLNITCKFNYSPITSSGKKTINSSLNSSRCY